MKEIRVLVTGKIIVNGRTVNVEVEGPEEQAQMVAEIIEKRLLKKWEGKFECEGMIEASYEG
jgi:hypothetical protein